MKRSEILAATPFPVLSRETAQSNDQVGTFSRSDLTRGRECPELLIIEKLERVFSLNNPLSLSHSAALSSTDTDK